MKSKTYRPSSNAPVWLEEGHRINEAVFCETFISTHKIVFCNGFSLPKMVVSPTRCPCAA